MNIFISFLLNFSVVRQLNAVVDDAIKEDVEDDRKIKNNSNYTFHLQLSEKTIKYFCDQDN